MFASLRGAKRRSDPERLAHEQAASGLLRFARNDGLRDARTKRMSPRHLLPGPNPRCGKTRGEWVPGIPAFAGTGKARDDTFVLVCVRKVIGTSTGIAFGDPEDRLRRRGRRGNSRPVFSSQRHCEEARRADEATVLAVKRFGACLRL
jgi:hypothetical protein